MAGIKPPRKLIWFTLALMCFIGGTSYFVLKKQLPKGIEIKTAGQPTIGHPMARVHVVVFDEPKCTNCKRFNDEVFPKIKQDFIDRNKIQFTIIPVSFLPGSMPAAEALLSVYYIDPRYTNSDLFFTFLDYMYDHQPDESKDWATVDKLIDFAHDASPAINLHDLRRAIVESKYRYEIERNNAYGKLIMGGSLATPTVYVNGVQAKDLNYDSIQSLIIQALEYQGVH